MKVEDPVESALRVSLRRAAAGPEPTPSLPDIVRRSARRQMIRRAGVGGSALLGLLVLAGSLVVIDGRHGGRATSVTAAGDPAVPELTRPIIVLPDCRATSAVEYSAPDVTLGRAATMEKSVQVLFDPSRPPPSGPLVVLERLPGKGTSAACDGATDGPPSTAPAPTSSPTTSGTVVPAPAGAAPALVANDTVAGQDATVSPVSPEGQAGADFELADGSVGLLTARQLTTSQVREVLDALRARSGVLSGFDLSSPAPAGLQMVDVAPLAAADVRTAWSDCVRSDGTPMWVTAISGDPAARYAALTGVPANAIGRDTGDSTLAVYGAPGDSRTAAALDSVTNASPNQWRSLLAAGPR